MSGFRRFRGSEAVQQVSHKSLCVRRGDATRARVHENRDIEWVTGFYAQLSSPDPNVPFPAPSNVGPEWAHLRWLQAQLFFALDLYTTSNCVILCCIATIP